MASLNFPAAVATFFDSFEALHTNSKESCAKLIKLREAPSANTLVNLYFYINSKLG